MNTENTTMTQAQQPEALRIADLLEQCSLNSLLSPFMEVANELRRQHARIEELEAQLSAIGAGGVEPLRKAAAADAPVVLPEPDAYLYTSGNHRGVSLEWRGQSDMAEGTERHALYTERQVRALLGGVFAPAAQGMNAPNEWEDIRTLPTCDDLIWLYCQDSNTIDGPIAPEPNLEEYGWSHWAYANAPSTVWIDAARAELAATHPTQPAAQGWKLVQIELLERIQESLGSFLSDQGWSQSDMDTADALGGLLAAAPQPPACNQSMQPELATYSAQTRNKKGIEQ